MGHFEKLHKPSCEKYILHMLFGAFHNTPVIDFESESIILLLLDTNNLLESFMLEVVFKLVSNRFIESLKLEIKILKVGKSDFIQYKV